MTKVCRITLVLEMNILHLVFFLLFARTNKNGTLIIIIMRLPICFRQWSELCGAACITTSADDMAKFMNFLLNGGKTESGLRLVDEEKMKELFLPWIHLQNSDIQEYFEKSRGVPFSRKYSGYGLGFNIGTYRGYWLNLFCWIF